MAQPSFDDENEAPLDPTLLRVQARLRRLMLIAGLTLGLGIFAVFAAILYRIVTLDATPAKPAAAQAPAAGAASQATVTFSGADLGLPDDARLVSTALDGGRVVLTFAHGDSHTVVVVDQETGRILSRIELPGH